MSEKFESNETKNQLIRKAENLAIEKFLKVAGNAKLKGSHADLNQVEGPTSSATTFSGTIKVNADVFYDKGLHNVDLEVGVMDNDVIMDREDSDIVTLLEESGIYGSDAAVDDPDTMLAAPMEASLSDFRIVLDASSNYLRVFHPSLDQGDKEIGLVSGTEWKTIKDKESFLKSMLENQVGNSYLEGHYTLNFTGSFVEPTITVEAVENHIITEAELPCETCHQPMADCKCDEKEASQDTSLPLALAADSYRQNVNFEEQKVQSQQDKVVNAIVNSLVAHLRSLKYDSITLGTTTPELTYNEGSFNGTVSIVATLTSKAGEHMVTLPIEVKENVSILPKKEAVSDLVSKAIEIKAEIEKSIAQEVLSQMERVDEHEAHKANEVKAVFEDNTIKKEAAGAGGMQFFGPTDSIQLDKNLLNMELEVGDTIFADGYHWQLVDKSANQLSAGENDGSLWSFRKVAPESKESENKVGL